MNLLILLHLFCVVFSWRVATRCQNNNNPVGYYLNLTVSGLNGGAVMYYIF